MTRKRLRDGVYVEEPISPATVNRNIAKLSGVFNRAVKFGFLPHNPASGMKALKVESPVVYVFYQRRSINDC